jgi:DNA-3-methyladenine glycosylase I
MAKERRRCAWADGDAEMTRYHDEEWGVPAHEETHLFEMLTLEGAQAGLSWRTVLHKREAYRKAFAGFDPPRVARFGERDVTRLMNDAGIVRNRLKIESTIANAKAILDVRKAGSLDALLWSFVGGATLVHAPASLSEVPATSPEATAMSKALKARGFRFVGPTICYALMQACGLVDDHVKGCFRSARSSGGARLANR